MERFGRIFLPLAILFLLLGIMAGLERGGLHHLNLGLHQSLATLHYVIFFSGFFGTLLSVESAVGQGKKWLFLIPATILIGTLLYITYGIWYIFVLGAAIFSIPSIMVFVQRKNYITFVIPCILFFLGAIFNVMNFYYSSALAYLYFITLYILAERLELAKIVGAGKGAFWNLVASELVILFAIVLSIYNLQLAIRLSGLTTLILAIWFWFNDLARKAIRTREPAKYSALAMLIGYIWLALGNTLFIVDASTFWGESIHSVTLGFVFSMVFAHAPIIFPNVAKVKFNFSRTLYIPLFLLHFSVLLRVVSHFLPNAKPIALYLNFISIIFFFATFIVLVRASKKQARQN
jgi:hypothetical protein